MVIVTPVHAYASSSNDIPYLTSSHTLHTMQQIATFLSGLFGSCHIRTALLVLPSTLTAQWRQELANAGVKQCREWALPAFSTICSSNMTWPCGPVQLIDAFAGTYTINGHKLLGACLSKTPLLMAAVNTGSCHQCPKRPGRKLSWKPCR